MVFKKNNSVMAVKRIRSTVDEREQKSLLMDLEVVMKSKGCPYIVMFNGAIFKVRIFIVSMYMGSLANANFGSWKNSP
jgi:hypothetical protein